MNKQRRLKREDDQTEQRQSKSGQIDNYKEKERKERGGEREEKREKGA